MKQFKCTFVQESYTVYYIEKINEAVIIARKLKESTAKTLGIDIETYKKVDHPKAGLDPHLTGISIVQVYDNTVKTCYIFDVIAVGLEWFSYIRDRTFVAHYAIFESKHFTHNGYPNLNIHCSMLLSILVDRAERSPYVDVDDDSFVDEEDEDEPSSWKGYGLDSIIGRLFDIRVDKKWQKYDWSIRPLPKEPLVYGALDAILTFKIAEIQSKKVNEYKMGKHYKILKDMQHVITEMELEGMGFDTKKHDILIKEWETKLKQDGIECAKHFGAINFGSTKQLNAWAKSKYSVDIIETWARTKKGALGFGKEALATMQHLPEMKALLSYKKTSKLLNTYGETLQAQINPVTKRLHCSFSLGETRTGRLSSREPNLQNLPRDSSTRDLFCAGAGKKLIVADFNQIELRVAGIVSNDKVLLNAYATGQDLHTLLASKIYHVPPSRVSKEQRQVAKSANFGAIYGMGALKFQMYVLKETGRLLPLEECKEIINGIWTLYSGYAVYCKKIRHVAEVQGFIRTPLGKMRKLHKKEVYTKAPNTVIQGGAFEVMAAAMLHLRKNLNGCAQIINSVHDEVIVESANILVNVVKKQIEDSMCAGMLQVFPKANIRGLAVAHIADTWGEGKG